MECGSGNWGQTQVPGLGREGGIWPKALGRGKDLTVGTGGQRSQVACGPG